MNGTTLFVKPLEEQQTFDTFLNHVTTQELSSKTTEHQEVWYAQTRKCSRAHFFPSTST